MGQSGGSDFKQTGMKQFSTQSAIIQDGDVFQGDSINPDRMPERKEELETIHSVIEPAARGDSPRNLFIYGKPGQGKTAAVKIKREQYEEFARANDLDIRMVYVECKSAKKSYHVLTTLLKKLKGLDSKPKGITLDDLYTRLYEYMNKEGGTFIFILDEIDQVQDDQDDDLNILYKLPRSHSSGELREGVYCSVIGISNDRQFISELDPRIKDSLYERELDFEVYSVTQLERILYRRAVNGLYDTEPVVNDEGVIVGVDSSVITDEVITLCAENAHRERGSARQAIDLLGQAATFAHDDRDDEISTNHVDTALEEVNKNYIKKMLGDCSADDLLTLCGVLYLYSRNETPARTDEIHKYYSKYAEAIGKEPLVQRRMRDRLQYLELNGILSMQKQTGGRMGGPRWESDLAIPFAETVDILGSDQEYEREYSAIAEEIGAGGKVDE